MLQSSTDSCYSPVAQVIEVREQVAVIGPVDQAYSESAAKFLGSFKLPKK